MNENIKKRLMDKVETVIERVEFIEEHLSRGISEDRLLRKAIYKEFQEYDGINDKIACYAIRELIEDLREFSLEVLKWIKK
uniref:DUF86 domain-containing protein n=1 Tax=Candidatus Methanophagaceae archaeon ANME-1 ERB6 TaxID=2759912 RepID=A0A7G9YRV8_9EURY|nr:hypothetical protein HAICDJOK_00002 [Methanosarcinales archaeon ANME-1 ERB6]